MAELMKHEENIQNNAALFCNYCFKQEAHGHWHRNTSVETRKAQSKELKRQLVDALLKMDLGNCKLTSSRQNIIECWS